MSKWLYKGKEVNDIEDFGEQTPFGFVYLIKNITTNKIYVGKKFLQHKKTKKLGKKAIAEQTGPGRKKTKEVTYAESDWKTYWGSCKPLHNDITLSGTVLWQRPTQWTTEYETIDQVVRTLQVTITAVKDTASK